MSLVSLQCMEYTDPGDVPRTPSCGTLPGSVYPHSGPKNYLQTVKIASAFMKEGSGSVGQSKCIILLWGETTNSDTQHTAPLLLRIPTVVGFHFLFQLSHGNPLPSRIALDWLGWPGQGGRQSTQTYHVRQTFGSSLPGLATHLNRSSLHVGRKWKMT